MKTSPIAYHHLFWWSLTLALLLGNPNSADGQRSLRQINPGTEISDVDFKGNLVFSEDRLKAQISSTGPDFLMRLQFWKSRPYPFQPIELQKDVVRLRNFYKRFGFLHPEIDYLIEFDEARNRVHIIFTIDSGPPVLVQDVNIVGPDADRPAFYQLPREHRAEWIKVRDRVLERIGGQFESNHLLTLRSELVTWLQNAGYAFAQVTTDTSIVHLHTGDTFGDYPDYIDIQVQVDPGPLSYISEINIIGNQTVARSVVLNAIPLRVGQQFSQQSLSVAQRQLFSLNLFRMALIDVPEQPRDSTVAVRVRIQEAERRYLSAQTGYSLTRGVDVEGQWQHRNFMGNARSLIFSANWSTGLAAFQRSSLVIPSRFRVGASLRQPFLFLPRLSGVISPFYERRAEQAFSLEQYGLNSTLVFDFYRFRTLSLEHTFSRTAPLQPTAQSDVRFSSRSIFNLGARLGRANDYFNPTEGFLIQPFLEASGRTIGSDLQYVKAGIETSFYDMIVRDVGVATRLHVGRLWPYGRSTDEFSGDRFNDIRFYAGGSNDVRGWHNQLMGPKEIASDTTRFIPLGGRAKLFANLELRLPFPFLGGAWGTTTFIDAGYIGLDQLRLNPTQYRYGAGAGIRYTTPIGPVRLDLAFKLNPSPMDLRGPAPDAEPSFWRRLVLYFSVGNPY